ALRATRGRTWARGAPPPARDQRPAARRPRTRAQSRRDEPPHPRTDQQPLGPSTNDRDVWRDRARLWEATTGRQADRVERQNGPRGRRPLVGERNARRTRHALTARGAHRRRGNARTRIAP